MTDLRSLVAAELNTPVEKRVSEMASAIAGRHGAASRAMLFYGSCLREKTLDGLMLDFYLIVSSYRLAYRKRWLGIANRLVPPNVMYFEHDGLVAKYAIMSEADFARECSPDAWTVSTAARFSQPSRLVWALDREAGERAIDSVSRAAPTLLLWTLPLFDGPIEERWKRAFSLTFDAELRAERVGRSDRLVEAASDRFRKFGLTALEDIERATGGQTKFRAERSRTQAERWWKSKQAYGKLYSVLRLAKASLTFAGGADYIVWKINRHSEAGITLRPWQRRHPLLAGISLLPRLLKSGAVR